MLMKQFGKQFLLIFSQNIKKKYVLNLHIHQSHYKEVPQWEIFMEQELRFGLDLSKMANLPAFIASKCFDL